jgi:hypothetical protein
MEVILDFDCIQPDKVLQFKLLCHIERSRNVYKTIKFVKKHLIIEV